MIPHNTNQFPNHDRTRLPTDQQAQQEILDHDEETYPAPSPLTSHPTLNWDRGRKPSYTNSPIYLQEEIQPQALIDSFAKASLYQEADLYGNHHQPIEDAEYGAYRHRERWRNRLIIGDSGRVIPSLLAREGYTGQVQTIYFDPPYAVNFRSNFQLTVDDLQTSENSSQLPHDAGAIRAFRNQYHARVNSYLDNLDYNLTLCRELLTESGSIFLQTGDHNLHQVATLMAQRFGPENHIATIPCTVGNHISTRTIPRIGNWIIWFAKDAEQVQYQQLYRKLDPHELIAFMGRNAWLETSDGKHRRLTNDERRNPEQIHPQHRLFRAQPLLSATASNTGRSEPFSWQGRNFHCPPGSSWSISHEGLEVLACQNRLISVDGNHLRWKQYSEEIPGRQLNPDWNDLPSANDERYTVQTPELAVERCILMTSKPGDLVLDPTCGSGTTAYCAEKWGRRWLTISASRLAATIARQRLATSIYEHYVLQDSPQGVRLETQLSQEPALPPSGQYDVARGLVCQRIRRITPATIAYGREEYIHLVDQPFTNPKIHRVCSAFTIESEHPPIHSLELQATDPNLELTREQILADLPSTGIVQGERHWKVQDLQRNPDIYLTHTATLENDDERVSLHAAIYVAPDDAAITPTNVRQLSHHVGLTKPAPQALLIIAHEFEASVAQDRRSSQDDLIIMCAEPPRQQNDLPRQPGAITLIGEPDVVLHQLENGQLQAEVLGINTYDPRNNALKSGKQIDVHCIITDTDYDGICFKARRINLPQGADDPQLQAIHDAAAQHLDPANWELLNTCITVPFNKPTSGRIAVKVIDRAAMETMAVIEV